MFSECIMCEQLWKTCDGSNLLLLPAPELFDWFKKYIAYHNISHQEIADRSGVSISTVHRVLAKDKSEVSDFKYDTIHSMILGCRGRHGTLKPCPDPNAAEHLANLQEIKKECDGLHEKIKNFETEKEKYEKESDKKLDYVKDQCVRLRKTAIIMTALLIFVLFGIIAFLAFDVINPSIGWLRG